jgi:hypothetical protein
VLLPKGKEDLWSVLPKGKEDLWFVLLLEAGGKLSVKNELLKLVRGIERRELLGI